MRRRSPSPARRSAPGRRTTPLPRAAILLLSGSLAAAGALLPGCHRGATRPPAALDGSTESPGPTAPRTAPAALGVLPFPHHVELAGETVPVPDTLRCAPATRALEPLIPVVDYEYRMLGGAAVVEAPLAAPADCRLAIDTSLAPDEYRVELGRPVEVTGGSYAAVARGTVVVLQALRRDDHRLSLPRGTIRDRPGSAYRGLLIDVARQWHAPDVLEQTVLLARWYGINFLQLHLTDDNAFTFPSETLPALSTPGHRYTRAELRRLNRFARDRGVTLVPELDVPGHAGQLTAQMPELFGVAGHPGSHTINMGREEAYEALDGLIGEIADVFETTPYIHMGADEARLEHLAEDPAVQAYMRRHALPDVRELYRHFLVRVDSMVRRHGRQTIVWEGFGPDGMVEIPRHILVMAWETLYQLPQELIDNGYTIINASWKPYYVAGVKKWPPETIYEWNLWKWGNWVPRMPSFDPIQIDSTPRVIGASMAAWAQHQHVEIPSLRRRVPAMAERAWTPTVEPRRPFREFERVLDRTDSLFGQILSPIRVEARGLRFPGMAPGSGPEREETWFGDTLRVMLAADGDAVVRYTLDGEPPGPMDARYSGPITLDRSAIVGARAFTPDGRPIGYPLRLEYQLHPIAARIEGELTTPLDSLWENADRRAPFVDSVRVHLRTLRPGAIRYTLDGSVPGPDSPSYASPIHVDRDRTVHARLFVDGHPVGEPWVQGFREAEPEEVGATPPP